MPFVPALRVVQADFRYLFSGEKCGNTLYFQRATTWSASAMETLGNELTNWWFDAMQGWTASTVSLNEIYLRDLTTENGLVRSHVTGLPLTGANISSPALPNSNSLCISFRTGLAGKSARGRNYVLGLVEGAVTANTVQSTTVDAIVDAYNDLFTYATTAGVTWVIVSRISGKLPRATALVTPVQSVLITDPYIDSQRRRLPGRGQ